MRPSWTSVVGAARAAGRPLVAFAPMAEITDSAFRTVAFAHGADLCVTEMVSAAGLVRDSRNTAPLLERLPEERGPTAVQLYGSDPHELEEAARRIVALDRFEAIDFNAGCPARKVVANGDGAALLRDPARVGRCVAALVRGADGALPVTMKTRIGADSAHPAAVELARAAEENGAALVALHGRYTSRGHAGPVDPGPIAEAVAAVRVPVLANGGVRSAADARELLSATGAAGIMVARGAVANPRLFDELRRFFDHGESESSSPALPDIVAALREHLRLLGALRRQIAAHCPGTAGTADPETAVALAFRRYLFNYFRGRPGSGAIRRRLCELKSTHDILSAVAAAFPDTTPPPRST